MTDRRSTLPVVVCSAAVLLLPLAVYLGGYVWLGEYLENPEYAVRCYEHRWMCVLFSPAICIESQVRRKDVVLLQSR
jgi:hypothetical protein